MLEGKFRIKTILFKDLKVLRAVLNNYLVWDGDDPEDFFVEYTIEKMDENDFLYDKELSYGNYFLPTLINEYNSDHKFYEKMLITLNDGTVVNDLNVKARDVSIIKLWYSIKTKGIRFDPSYEASLSAQKPNRICELKSVHTKNFTTMERMFYLCSYLTSIDCTKKWNTLRTKSMKEMFYGCTKLVALEALEQFNTLNVEDMTRMFNGCKSLLSPLNISTFNTRNVKYMTGMFAGCTFLGSIDITTFNTSSLINADSMFSGCESLETFIANDMELPKLESAYRMFASSGIKNISLINWKTDNIKKLEQMFFDCDNLEIVDFSNWNTGTLTNMIGMFEECGKLTKVNMTNWNTQSLEDLTRAFYNCINLEEIAGMESFNVSNLKRLTNTFYRCFKLKVDLSNWTPYVVNSMYGTFNQCNSETTVTSFLWSVSPTDMTYTFAENTFTDVSLPNYDLTYTTSLSYLFRDCTQLEYAYLSNLNTDCVNMSSMFYMCGKLKHADLRNIRGITTDSRNVSYMFYNCKSLEYLNLSNLNTLVIDEDILDNDDKVFNSYYMLYGVPETVQWDYDGSNYTNWTLTEKETRFAGTFPWNERIYTQDFGNLVNETPAEFEDYYFDKQYMLRIYKNGGEESSKFMLVNPTYIEGIYPTSTCFGRYSEGNQMNYSFIEFEINVECGSLIELEYAYAILETNQTEPDQYWNTTGFAICSSLQPSSHPGFTQTNHVWEKATPEESISQSETLTIETPSSTRTTLFIQMYAACKNTTSSISELAIKKITITKLEE